jgi:hypothetical protein
MPSTATAKFALKVTVPNIGSYYLAKGGQSTGTQRLADAAVCSITSKTELICDNMIVGAGGAKSNHMVLLKNNDGQTITTGFSIGQDKRLHWVNSQFLLQKEIREKQGGEVLWALYPQSNGYEVYAQLGMWHDTRCVYVRRFC